MHEMNHRTPSRSRTSAKKGLFLETPSRLISLAEANSEEKSFRKAGYVKETSSSFRFSVPWVYVRSYLVGHLDLQACAPKASAYLVRRVMRRNEVFAAPTVCGGHASLRQKY
jgi:hypothetical protein